jgi:peptide-methionine (R)-S-oxide reductase
LTGGLAGSRRLFKQRTKVLCRRSGGHPSHVFDDDPQPTGLRHCMDGPALNFKAR